MKTISLLKTEEAISYVKRTFTDELSRKLSLTPVSAPIIVMDKTGINDDLNGIERPVKFPIKSMQEEQAVVVHSLAKWKRMRLAELNIEVEKGIITDMRALRPDEDYSRLHSIYVDQWDWEKHMFKTDRTLDYLKETVKKVYESLKATEQKISEKYPGIDACLPSEITFIHAEELLKLYPELSPKEREDKITEKFGAVFIIGIGGKLSDGEPHDGRAPDYDDWSTKNEDGFYGLNGDIIVWHPTLKCAFEISSMGIRVDKKSLKRQLEIQQCPEKAELKFHKLLLEDELPQSIGGGIGQSRVCMFMLRKTHIGEVQVSVWPDAIKAELAEEGVALL
ncbi:aspartate--ammonia ligase [Seonamhaeicola sp.]|uniref:aspartate--ammonia ligase n=1 Tax=Seonamhaeicola sp. TaxID=1912245 RepID=UPI00261376B7|nr:aspartate--ammonia ligase [Seonamhaeicola sp.]